MRHYCSSLLLLLQPPRCTCCCFCCIIFALAPFSCFWKLLLLSYFESFLDFTRTPAYAAAGSHLRFAPRTWRARHSMPPLPPTTQTRAIAFVSAAVACLFFSQQWLLLRGKNVDSEIIEHTAKSVTPATEHLAAASLSANMPRLCPCSRSGAAFGSQQQRLQQERADPPSPHVFTCGYLPLLAHFLMLQAATLAALRRSIILATLLLCHAIEEMTSLFVKYISGLLLPPLIR